MHGHSDTDIPQCNLFIWTVCIGCNFTGEDICEWKERVAVCEQLRSQMESFYSICSPAWALTCDGAYPMGWKEDRERGGFYVGRAEWKCWISQNAK